MTQSMKKPVTILFVFLLMSLIPFSCSSHNKSKAPSIAVTTSYLECAARDIMGNDVNIVRLVPPGICPGHFDIAPGIIKELKNCKVLLRFDFQNGMDEKVRAIAPKTLTILAIPAPAGLCIPESYLQVLEISHKGLCATFPEQIVTYDDNLKNAQTLIKALEIDSKKRIRETSLDSVKVIASGHQSFFSKWLGLDVVAEYSGADSTSPLALQTLLDNKTNSEVRFVIANLQEGGQMGNAIASRLGVPLVVFSNFPSMTPDEHDYFSLFRNNLNKLLASQQK